MQGVVSFNNRNKKNDEEKVVMDERRCIASRGRERRCKKENVKQEQKYHKQYKQGCHTVPVPKTPVIPVQKCQDDSKQKYQTEYGKKS